jgi:hypothetical protein
MPAFCFNEEIEKPVGTLAVKNPSRLYKRNVFKRRMNREKRKSTGLSRAGAVFCRITEKGAFSASFPGSC